MYFQSKYHIDYENVWFAYPDSMFTDSELLTMKNKIFE